MKLSPDKERERAAIEFNAPTGRGFGLAAFMAIAVWPKARRRGWQPLQIRFGQ